MRIQPKGYEAVLQRVHEIKTRVNALNQGSSQSDTFVLPGARPAPMGGRVAGPINGLPGLPGLPGGPNIAGQMGFEPLDPLSLGMELNPTSSAPPHIARMINQAAQSVGIDPRLFDALVRAESNYRVDAVSPAGARGLAQLMPATARSLGVQNIDDPWQNLEGGARYLKAMLDRFGDPALALAAYNAGPGRVSAAGNQIPNIRETQNYVRKVLGTAGYPLP